MSFRKFKSDVSTAAQQAAAGAIPGVLSVSAGDSDGEVVLKYRHQTLPREACIRALAQDVTEYPDGNMFMVWTDDDDPPPAVVSAIKGAQNRLMGMSVSEMVTKLARRLEKHLSRRLKGASAEEGQEDEEEEEEEGGESDNDGDDNDDDDDGDGYHYDAAYDADYPSDGDEFGLPPSSPRRVHPSSSVSRDQRLLLKRIRRDLRRVKQAGYNVGFLDEFGRTAVSGIVSISVRVGKLALSDEAMEAWNVKPSDYVVLLLLSDKRYETFEHIIARPAAQAGVQFRIGKCTQYKPSLAQARAAFTEGKGCLSLAASDTCAKFEKLLISNSLDQFLGESFISLLKLRETRGLDWDKANELLRARTGLCGDSQQLCRIEEGVNAGGSPSGPERIAERHRILAPDHLLERDTASERSLPLIAMQFAMRYFVKCTEYCLRCHRRLEKGFEALRPYVCSDPLCLFQYMAMGFGPNIEHEILTEPYVVDLLVSLCYAAIQPFATQSATPSEATSTEAKLPIRSLPVGLRLKVPDLSNTKTSPLKARVSVDPNLLIFDDEGNQNFDEVLGHARWIAFRIPGQSLTHHARVLQVNQAARSAVIELKGKSAATWGPGNHAPRPGQSSNAKSPPESRADWDGVVEVFPYVTDFDTLDDHGKGVAMRHILDTLPSILEIEEWLKDHPQGSLRSMERISPAAESLLQWIVSSNRSCILQVDRSRAVTRPGAPAPGSTASQSRSTNSGEAGRGRNRERERILGMDGWVQFRFAQGSPDKELRFKRALQEVATRKPIQANPTIFAWHGSNLANWHSIVRSGLDYKDIRTGRAYGDGVYFSRHAETSISYAGGRPQSWPNSDLKISGCVSLNEIINAPDEFVSRTPHYVVSQLDWHQCRYLFVRTDASDAPTGAWAREWAIFRASRATPVVEQGFYPQAPGLEVYGQGGAPLRIPLSAIPLRTIGPGPDVQPVLSKRAVERLEDSDKEDEEDVAILFTDDEFTPTPDPPSKRAASRPSSAGGAARGGVAGPPAPVSIDRSLTDFEPGALDLSSLPRLDPPSFATDSATRALSRELVRLQSIQAKTPLHELGWYMDFDQVSNLFQWIVELHSFDATLPLAQDMKRAGVRSVVLELRFGGDFPFSPPFVRVVRPRFMPFFEGGGGHVTAGGAMCMELLTSSGWSPANSLESVLLQVRMALCSLEPRPARLDRRVTKNGPRLDYGIAEAIDAYVRAAKAHNWVVPDKLRLTANGV